MAVMTVAFSELDTFLQGLEPNTPETPYELNITGISDSSSASTVKTTLNKYPSIYIALNEFTGSFTLSDASQCFRQVKTIISVKGDFSTVTVATFMFEACTMLKTIDTQTFTNVQIARSMFMNCSSLELVDFAPMSLVENFNSVCTRCSSLKEINNFGSSKVTQATGCFAECINLKKASNITLPHITLNNFFQECYALEEVENVDFSGSKSADYLFYNLTKLRVIKGLNLFSSTSAISLCAGCSDLQIFENVTLNNATHVESMFGRCSSLKMIDLSCLGEITNASGLFTGCSSLEKIDNFNLKNTASHTRMFTDTQNITVITVPNMLAKYHAYSILEDPATEFISSKTVKETVVLKSIKLVVSDLADLFSIMPENSKTQPEVIDLCEINTSEDLTTIHTACTNNLLKYIALTESHDSIALTDYTSLFETCSNLVSFTADFPLVENCSKMFKGCSNLTEVDCDFSQITNASYMFSGCTSFTDFDIRGFTSLTNASYMFEGCTGITIYGDIPDTFRLSSPDSVSGELNIQNASGMFKDCSNLATVDTSDFSTVISADEMFKNCSSLSTFDASGFENTESINLMFAGCENLETIENAGSLFTTNVTSYENVFSGCDELTEIKTENLNDGIGLLTILNSGDCGLEKSFETQALFTPDDIRVSVDNLSAYLDALLENSKDTPYEVDIYNVVSGKERKLTTTLQDNPTKYLYLNESEDSFTGSDAYALFQNCTSLIKVDFRFSDTYRISLGSFFEGCTNLKEVTFYGHQNYLYGHCMFAECSSLEKVTLPDDWSFPSTANEVFTGCSSLKSVSKIRLDNGLYVSFFEGCSSLKSVDIEGSVGTAEAFFRDCRSLESVDMSIFKNVQSMQNVLKNCSSLESVDLSPLNQLQDAVGLCAGCTSLKTVKMPKLEKLENAEMMFSDCTSLEEFDMGFTEQIGNAISMFERCSNLKSITNWNLNYATTSVHPENYTNMLKDTSPDLVIALPYKNEQLDHFNYMKIDVASNNATVKKVPLTKGQETIQCNFTLGADKQLQLNFVTDEILCDTQITDELAQKMAIYRYPFTKMYNTLDPAEKNFVIWADPESKIKQNIANGEGGAIVFTQAQWDSMSEDERPADGTQVIITDDAGDPNVFDDDTVRKDRGWTSDKINGELANQIETNANNCIPPLHRTKTYELATTAENVPSSQYAWVIHSTLMNRNNLYRVTQVAESHSEAGLYVRIGISHDNGASWTWGSWEKVITNSDVNFDSTSKVVKIGNLKIEYGFISLLGITYTQMGTGWYRYTHSTPVVFKANFTKLPSITATVESNDTADYIASVAGMIRDEKQIKQIFLDRPNAGSGNTYVHWIAIGE